MVLVLVDEIDHRFGIAAAVFGVGFVVAFLGGRPRRIELTRTAISTHR